MAESITLKQELVIQKIYVKDLSFESPGTPHTFRGEWKPEINLELNVANEKLSENEYEIVLRVTLTVKKDNKVIFVVEAKQAGIFLLKGFSAIELAQVCGAFCPNILFPYARETLSDIMNRGGFPPIYLAPINFDALYTTQQQQEKYIPKIITH